MKQLYATNVAGPGIRPGLCDERETYTAALMGGRTSKGGLGPRERSAAAPRGEPDRKVPAART